VTDTTTVPGKSVDTSRHLGLVARILGVILSPRDTYADVAARPRVLGMLVFVLAVTIGSQVWFLSTDVGKNALLDQQTKAMDSLRSMGVNIPDSAYDQLESRLVYAPYTTGGSILVFTPIVYAILAGIFLMVFNAFLGGLATFKHVYAVIVHSAVIGALQQLFNVPISYARAEMTSATQLSVFFPMLDDMSFLRYFLSALDLFIIWLIVSGSIGLGVLYKRRTGPIAIAQLAIYLVIALMIAAFRAS
jgi:hypothetical protein